MHVPTIMNSKSCRVALLRLLALPVLAASISGQAAPEPKSIHVVLDDDYPPYIFRGPDGRMQGILKDLWTLWQQRTGIAVDFQPMQWDKARATMESGHADVIDTIFATPEREKIYDFSRPYAKIEVPIFFDKRINGITDAASLKGFTVGVKDGDACVNYLKGHDINMLRYYPSYDAVVQAAVKHQIRLLCIDKPPAFYLFERGGAADQFRYSPPLYTGQFHWAVAKGRTDLKRLVEAGFALISPAERAAIETRWLGQTFAQIQRSKTLRYGGYVLLVVALMLAVLAGWNRALRRRVRARTRELSATLRGLRQSEQRFRNFFELGQTGMAITSPEQSWLNVNPRFCEMFGYTKEELTGMTWAEMTHPDDIEANMALFRRLVSGEIEHYSMDKRYFHKNGDIVYAHLTASCQRRPDRSVEYILATLEDITERKQAETKVQRLTQIYVALSECNQAIMRSKSEAELFPIICRNAVNFGGMQMAWIGMVDEIGKCVRPVASFGNGTEYLDDIGISLDPNSPTAGGPTCRSVREKQPFWINDFQHDPIATPWHERAAKYDWGASASLPLYRNGAVIGAFGLYSGYTNAFDQPMRDLLVEMAADISYALDYFENMDKRKLIEQELEDRENQLTLIYDNVQEIIFAIGVEPNDQFRFISVNRRFIEATGIPLNRIAGRLVQDIIPEPSLTLVLGKYREAIQSRRPVSWEEVTEYPVGKKIGMVSVSAMFDTCGNCTQLIGTVYDITELRQAAIAFQESEEQYGLLISTMAEGVTLQDENSAIVAFNESAERILGLTSDQLRGKTSLDPSWFSIHEDGSPFPGETHPVVMTLKSGLPQSDVIMGIHKPNGDLTWISINVQPIFKAGMTTPDRVVATMRDITAQKRLEEERKHLFNEVRELSRRLIDIQEQERQAIALTLHDNIGQSLTAIKAYASSITHYSHLQDLDRVLQSANEVNHITTGLLKTIRNQLRDLRPGYVNELGLKGALENLCESWENSGAIACNLKITGAVDELPNDIQVQLFRIVQEGLTNVARHAAASTASVELSTGRHGLKLDIADDGRGFDPATTVHGIGLVGMRERVFAFGGLFDLNSVPGAGTQIRILFQVDPDQEIL